MLLHYLNISPIRPSGNTIETTISTFKLTFRKICITAKIHTNEIHEQTNILLIHYALCEKVLLKEIWYLNEISVVFFLCKLFILMYTTGKCNFFSIRMSCNFVSMFEIFHYFFREINELGSCREWQTVVTGDPVYCCKGWLGWRAPTTCGPSAPSGSARAAQVAPVMCADLCPQSVPLSNGCPLIGLFAELQIYYYPRDWSVDFWLTTNVTCVEIVRSNRHICHATTLKLFHMRSDLLFFLSSNF